jgi:hypothetical protein
LQRLTACSPSVFITPQRPAHGVGTRYNDNAQSEAWGDFTTIYLRGNLMNDIPVWHTLLAYVFASAAIYFAVPAMLQGLFGALFSIITFRTCGVPVALLFGSFAAWLLLALIWRSAEGGMMPMVLFAGGFLFLFAHSHSNREELTSESLRTMGAEAWGIVIAAIFILLNSDPIRWY